MYDIETIKEFFDNQRKHLEELVVRNTGLETAIANLEERISKETNPDRKTQYQERLKVARTNFELNQLSIKTTIDLMNKTNKLNLTTGYDTLYSLVDEKIANQLVNKTDTSLEVSTEMIFQKFTELNLIFAKYKAETDEIKKRKLLEEFGKTKIELMSMKSKLSCRMRKLHKAGKTTTEEFEKFKKEQLAYNKEHFSLYKEMAELNKKQEKAKEDVVTKEEPIAKEDPKVNEEPVVNEEPIIKGEVITKEGNVVKEDDSIILNPINFNIDSVRMKESKNADKLINSVQSAIDSHEKLKETSVYGSKEEIKKALKEDKKAQRKINIVRNPELLKQRDQLAQELGKLREMYGTANNPEYQMRLEQLKKLDKLIFGHKATKIYKDFKKPVNMVGGTYIELPKEYIDMRLERLGQIR